MTQSTVRSAPSGLCDRYSPPCGPGIRDGLDESVGGGECEIERERFVPRGEPFIPCAVDSTGLFRGGDADDEGHAPLFWLLGFGFGFVLSVCICFWRVRPFRLNVTQGR